MEAAPGRAVAAPALDADPDLAALKWFSALDRLSPGFKVMLSPEPFSRGLPGLMRAVLAPTAAIPCRTALATGSGPLPDRRRPGTRARRSSPAVSVCLRGERLLAGTREPLFKPLRRDGA